MQTMHNTPETNGKAEISTPHYHAVVLLDRHEARVIHFNIQAFEEEIVQSVGAPRHLHIKVGSNSPGLSAGSNHP